MNPLVEVIIQGRVVQRPSCDWCSKSATRAFVPRFILGNADDRARYYCDYCVSYIANSAHNVGMPDPLTAEVQWTEASIDEALCWELHEV